MEFSEIINLIDSLGTIGILIWAWYMERRRSESLSSHIIADWKRQNDRETMESQKSTQ